MRILSKEDVLRKNLNFFAESQLVLSTVQVLKEK